MKQKMTKNVNGDLNNVQKGFVTSIVYDIVSFEK